MRGRTSQSDFSRSQSCSTKRSIRNLSPLTGSIDRLDPTRKREGIWAHFGIAAVQLVCARIFMLGNQRRRTCCVKAKEPQSAPPSVLLFC
jgi:hypothetical protein